MNSIGYYFDIDNKEAENWIDTLSPEQKILLASGLLQVGIDEQYERKTQSVTIADSFGVAQPIYKATLDLE